MACHLREFLGFPMLYVDHWRSKQSVRLPALYPGFYLKFGRWNGLQRLRQLRNVNSNNFKKIKRLLEIDLYVVAMATEKQTNPTFRKLRFFRPSKNNFQLNAYLF